MPARHISSQSFDEILSELGDDPAIPDPHGIRKPPPQTGAPSSPQIHGKASPHADPLSFIQIKHLLQGYTGQAILIGLFIAAGIAFFVAYNAFNDSSQDALEASQKQISELKKEIALIRHEMDEDIDSLYSVIDEIEVSVHSFKNSKPEIRAPIKSQGPNHESELRRWRYLGTSQTGPTQKAYFHTGTNHLVFEKGAQVLGDWRLNIIEKEAATLTHPQGKPLVLKASKSE
jgi:hypothetical protein